MHKYMDETQVKLNGIGEAIYKTYLFCPPADLPEPEPAAAATTEQAGSGQSQKQG
jgi:hypothetical protein